MAGFFRSNRDSCCISNSLFMGIQYKLYFCRLRLLRFLDVKENHGQKASRRPCRVVYGNIRGLLKNLYVRGGDVPDSVCTGFLIYWIKF